VALIVWVYYSAQIFFFGAEFTRVYAELRAPTPGSRSARRAGDRLHRPRCSILAQRKNMRRLSVLSLTFLLALGTALFAADVPQAGQAAPAVTLLRRTERRSA